MKNGQEPHGVTTQKTPFFKAKTVSFEISRSYVTLPFDVVWSNY
jgi:hypothetical protein